MELDKKKEKHYFVLAAMGGHGHAIKEDYGLIMFTAALRYLNMGIIPISISRYLKYHIMMKIGGQS